METNNENLYGKFTRLQWLMRRQQSIFTEAQGPLSDPTKGQGRVIAALRVQPEIRTKELANLLGIGVPSLNELVSKLEKGGYAERIPAPNDRRVMLVRLTQAGREIKQEFRDPNELFSVLAPAEQQQFGEYLDRLAGSIEAVIGTTPDSAEWEIWLENAKKVMSPEQLAEFSKRQNQMDFGKNPPAL